MIKLAHNKYYMNSSFNDENMNCAKFCFICYDYTFPADDDWTLEDGKVSRKIAGCYGQHRG